MTTNTKKYNLIKGSSRGHADHGWLKSSHSFSFANYYDPERVHFGALRVLNDDYVAAGEGFGKHPHDNMEIISIPLSGELNHRDNMGNTTVIKEGEVQVMSAGTGIIHSEMNNRTDLAVEFLQIWVFPDKMNVKPRYDQKVINKELVTNRLGQIVSPNEGEDGVWIHQQAWFYLGGFDDNQKIDYAINKSNNGIYIFLIEGKATVDGHKMDKRDALAVADAETISIDLNKNTKILVIEVPMIW
jgi:redox-sensitive bicupin YhaK (pirin superfamily)